MSAALLVILLVVDLLLLGVVFFLGRSRINPMDLVRELTEERRLLTELRTSIKEEMSFQEEKGRQVVEKVSALATEIEMEIKTQSETLSTEVERVLNEVSTRIEEPLLALTKKQAALEALLSRVSKEKQILQSKIQRGERICKFFDQRLPYQEVLEEIEDKKYLDARALLSKGIPPDQVAQELSVPLSEIHLLLGLSR